MQTDLRCRLEKDLVAIAKLIDIQEQTDQVDNEIAAYVLESAFKLAVRPNDPRTTSRPLNSLLERFFCMETFRPYARGLYSVKTYPPINCMDAGQQSYCFELCMIMNEYSLAL